MLKTRQIRDIKKAPTKEKIGFFSVILLVVGACIGAGIFFKNQTVLKDSWGSILLAIICWVIASLGVLIMGLTLAEICSANNRYSNQGIVGWVRIFNNWFIYKICKNYMTYIMWPLIIASMGFFFAQSIQNALGWHAQWYWIVLISFLVPTWFIFTSGISVRIANISNWIIMMIKFFPIVFAIVIGWVVLGITHGLADNSHILPVDPNNNTPLLDKMNPGFGVIAAIPAIFFAFNGFYFPASFQTQMKEPKKSSMAMAIGIAIVAFVYVAIAVSLMLCSRDGTVVNIQFLQDHAPIVIKIIYILIAVGVLSVINSKTIASNKIYEDLILNKQIIFWHRFFAKANDNRPIHGAFYTFILMSIYMVLVSVIGIFFANTSHYDASYMDSWGVAGLYSFMDIVSDWLVLFIFVIITVAILGALINRKTNKVKVTRSKIFVPVAWITLIMMSIILLYQISSVFVNLGLVIYYYSNQMYSTKTIGDTWLLSVIMSIVMLFIYIGVSVIPALVTQKNTKPNYHIN